MGRLSQGQRMWRVYSIDCFTRKIIPVICFYPAYGWCGNEESSNPILLFQTVVLILYSVTLDSGWKII